MAQAEAGGSVVETRRQEHLLIETIKQVGVSNYSLIARLTGLNAETVRYKVNKQLTRMGLSVLVNIDYGQLGFASGLLFVKSPSTQGSTWAEHLGYLTFLGKVTGMNRYICMYAVPYRFKKRYLDALSLLQQKGMVEEFESKEISWVRYPPFRPEFYDFDERRWIVDWRRIDLTTTELGASCSFINRDAKVDHIDVQLLRCIQEDPTSDVSKMAKEINANPRTMRYHYSEHVLKNKFLLSYNMRWVRPISEGKLGDLMQIVSSFKDLNQKEIALARSVFNKIPFTWLETETLEGGYSAFLDIPIANFHETARHIEGNTESLRDRFRMEILDPSATRPLNVPYEMYDPERGWRLIDAQEVVTARSAEVIG